MAAPVDVEQHPTARLCSSPCWYLPRSLWPSLFPDSPLHALPVMPLWMEDGSQDRLEVTQPSFPDFSGSTRSESHLVLRTKQGPLCPSIDWLPSAAW